MPGRDFIAANNSEGKPHRKNRGNEVHTSHASRFLVKMHAEEFSALYIPLQKGSGE